jgi:hypothetical protein
MTSNQPWWLTWPAAEVAATILPLFASAKRYQEVRVLQAIVEWCKTGRYDPPRNIVSNANAWKSFEDPDLCAIAEAMQVLEHASLLRELGDGGEGFVGLTRLGMHALQTDTVRQHLGLDAALPTVSN